MTFVKAKRAQSVEDDETWEPNRPAPTLNQFDNNHETRATVLTVYGRTQFANYSEGPVTLNASMVKRPYENMAVNDTAVRRLTPIECERLMGWPDNWTHTTANGKQQADSHRYRQIGNGVATPVTQWIGNRLSQ
jgi:site-specific DNA-cytosine methylase